MWFGSVSCCSGAVEMDSCMICVRALSLGCFSVESCNSEQGKQKVSGARADTMCFLQGRCAAKQMRMNDEEDRRRI
jgi:hypothetical protein